MLINQAAISFQFWTNQTGPIAVMKEALLQEFTADI
jgi:shikimate 5-dehydrogenase